MQPGRVLIAVLLCVGLSAPARAAPTRECWTSGEAEAKSVRALQTLLMVAALQCRARPDLGLVSGYNRLIRERGSDLARYSDTLRQRFVRVHGAGWQSLFDRYLTQLANHYAATAQAPGFCEQASAVATQALDLAQGGLARVAQDAPPADEPLPCAVEGATPR